MATWHQQRNLIPLYSGTEWTVVDDPPNKCTGLVRFPTQAEAEAYLERRKKLGTGDHCYILRPQSHDT